MKWGPYELDSLIHEGGGGLVVKGRISTQVCAIKIVLGAIPFSDQKLERLNRAASLSQHLIKYDRVTSLPSALVIQTRFYEAVNLTELLRESELSREARIAIAQQVVDALVILHQSGLVHGDVRPENVMLTRSGRVILLDVDQSVELLAPEAERIRLRVGMNALTPDHVRGLGLTRQSDMFAFASFCIELFTGFSPLVVEGELDYAQLEEPILPEPSNFHWFPESETADLINMLQNCWTVTPDVRPRSLDPMKALLKSVLPDSAQAQIELSGAVAQQYEERWSAPIDFVLPQFENEHIVGAQPEFLHSRGLWVGVLSAAAVLLIAFRSVFFSASEPLHPAIHWHVKEPSMRLEIAEIRPYLEQEWQRLVTEVGRDASSHHLSWAEQMISIDKVRSGRRVVFECGRDLCIVRVISGEAGWSEVWHEPILIGSSRNRWKALLQRAVAKSH